MTKNIENVAAHLKTCIDPQLDVRIEGDAILISSPGDLDSAVYTVKLSKCKGGAMRAVAYLNTKCTKVDKLILLVEFGESLQNWSNEHLGFKVSWNCAFR